MLLKIEKQVYKIEALVISLSLLVIFLAITAQVLIRLIGMNSAGTAEIGMFGMSLLTFIGTPAIMYTKDRITIEIAETIKSEKIHLLLDALVTILILVFSVVFIQVVYNLFLFILESGEKTLELGLPVTIPIGSMVIGMGLLIFHSICDFAKLYKRYKNMNTASKEE